MIAFLTRWSLEIIHIQGKSSSGNCHWFHNTLPRLTFRKIFSISWVTHPTLLGTRSNVISQHPRWMRVNWITALWLSFCTFTLLWHGVLHLEYWITSNSSWTLATKGFRQRLLQLYRQRYCSSFHQGLIHYPCILSSLFIAIQLYYFASNGVRTLRLIF